MSTLTIAALSTPETISNAALCACRNTARLFLQTERTPCALPLRGLPYKTMDALYEQAGDFDDLNARVADRLLDALAEGDVVYAVPGRMGGCGAALKAKAEAAGHAVHLLGGAGYAQAALAAAGISSDRLSVCTATSLPAPDPAAPLAVEEVDTPLRAGEVKLALSEYYPDAHTVLLCRMDAQGRYDVSPLPLYELDRQAGFHATTVLLVPPVELLALDRFGYAELEAVMHRLRAPGGCPWDAEQTHESLKKSLIEECYEVLDAIDAGDDAALCEELGDVLLQCVFHAEIACEQRRFTGRDVTTGIVQKLIYRHPHVFGTGKADTAEAVVTRWEQLKKTEKHFKTQTDVLRAVPRGFPALMRAYKLQKKAAQVGFDWPDAYEAYLKIPEESEELIEAMNGNGDIAGELGDLMFAVVNVARLLHLDPEETLTQASDKFLRRFAAMEVLASSEGKLLEGMPLMEQEALWQRVKSAENRQE